VQTSNGDIRRLPDLSARLSIGYRGEVRPDNDLGLSHGFTRVYTSRMCSYKRPVETQTS
jgi:hypothetical protein